MEDDDTVMVYGRQNGDDLAKGVSYERFTMLSPVISTHSTGQHAFHPATQSRRAEAWK